MRSAGHYARDGRKLIKDNIRNMKDRLFLPRGASWIVSKFPFQNCYNTEIRGRTAYLERSAFVSLLHMQCPRPICGYLAPTSMDTCGPPRAVTKKNASADFIPSAGCSHNYVVHPCSDVIAQPCPFTRRCSTDVLVRRRPGYAIQPQQRNKYQLTNKTAERISEPSHNEPSFYHRSVAEAGCPDRSILAKPNWDLMQE